MKKRNVEADSKKLQYFEMMTSLDRNLVENWYVTQKAKTDRQAEFLKIVGKALKKINYQYSISAIEPSVDEYGRIYFEKGAPVARYISCEDWIKKAKKFAPTFKSDLASLYELYLWYAYRIALGYWTLEDICDNVAYLKDRENETYRKKFDLSGEKEIGGASDGVGNTYKLVKTDSVFGCAMCGGGCYYYGHYYPLTAISYWTNKQTGSSHSTGVIVLRKYIK